MTRIAIIGGGPGGLFAAHLLEEYCPGMSEVTLFEASPRVGGKVLTQRFQSAPVLYEAGVAELYDYSHLGPDPVRQLVDKLGLKTVPMEGPAVVFDGHVVNGYRDLRRHFGKPAEQALRAFHEQCRALCTPADYYEGHWQDDNEHPWNDKTFRDVLDAIPDEAARKYVEVAARSDIATEAHLTSALNGLKNVLMDDPRYLRLYSIVGGIQQLVDGLAKRLRATAIHTSSPVVRIARKQGDGYRLTVRRAGRDETHDFDLVMAAVPNYWLQSIDWGDPELRRVMQKHLAHYDKPAHYLRVSILFEQPFWRQQIPGAYFMLDAFGGCCVYDESARHPAKPHGVLSWLLAGNDALTLSNCDDAQLLDMVLDSLPASLAHGRELFVEGRVHRWVGTISALPGGQPVHEVRRRHLPEPSVHPNLYLIGDYLFDSTINGVFDSADFVTDMILTVLRKKKYGASRIEVASNGSTNGVHVGNGATKKNAPLSVLPKDYHDLYDGKRPYSESWLEYFCEYYTTDIIRAIWGWSPPYKLLDCGSASGLTLAAFEKLGVEAWGVENSEHIHRQTPAKWKSRNLRGDVRKLPFPDNSFDFVYDTCLCHLPEGDLDQAIRELFRVCRVGLFYGGYSSDMTPTVIEAYDIYEDATSLFTLWEWSEIFMRNGFRVATSDQKRLARAWKIEVNANDGEYHWYPDPDTMRYCFYSKPDAPPPPTRKRKKLLLKAK